MTQPENTVQIEVGPIENICFVVMPFDSLFQIQYERVIRPAIEELGLKCVRGDEIYSKPQIMSDIWASIRRARFVVAELTGRNANVFYEIGLAHALGKPIILLTRNENDVPFDLKSLRYRYYSVEDPFWGDNLRESLQTMIKNILDQPEFPTYLEGITTHMQLPGMPKTVNLSLAEKSSSQINISGDWKVSFLFSSDSSVGQFRHDLNLEHNGAIHIVQETNNLSAIMTVSFEISDVVAVVQETLTGRIDGNQVTLNGVSYTYVHKGKSQGYELDNFNLQLRADSTTLAGSVASASSKGEAVLTR